MSVFYERCPCGAEFRVEVETHDSARDDLRRWRKEHRHEMPPGDHYADNTGTSHRAGWTDIHLGFIAPSAQEDM